MEKKPVSESIQIIVKEQERGRRIKTNLIKMENILIECFGNAVINVVISSHSLRNRTLGDNKRTKKENNTHTHTQYLKRQIEFLILQTKRKIEKKINILYAH